MNMLYGTNVYLTYINLKVLACVARRGAQFLLVKEENRKEKSGIL
jgi:hypothetical protein